MASSTHENIKFVSLFSGAMGLDLGLEEAAFKPILALENDQDAVSTIRHNRPELPVIARSISTVGGAEIRSAAGLSPSETIPLVVGGPPCQAFSVFGKRKGLDDARGQMLFEFVRIVDELQPHAFVMENVRGLLSMPLLRRSDSIESDETRPGSLLQELLLRFDRIGYRVDCFVVNAVNYGAPQLRERLILIGNRHGLECHFPSPTRSNRPEDQLPPFSTLGDAIGGSFVDTDTDLMDFSARKLGYLAQVPPGGNWRSLPEAVQKESMGRSWYLKGGRSAYWRRLSFNFPSPTVVTMPNHAGTSMCHPNETRAITVGEAAAIQEFPRQWAFMGTPQSKFRQIGNAVPVRLGQVAGDVVRDLLAQITINSDEPTSKEAPPSQITHVRPHVRTRQYWKDGVAKVGDYSYYASA